MKAIENSAAVIAAIKPVNAMLTWFEPYLKHWHREAGAKPTLQMLMVPLLLGKRPGVEALHIAMTLRAEGCTVQQFCLAGSCGPANNYRRSLVKAGWFACTVTGKPYAFTLALTAKGEAALNKAIAVQAVVAEKPATAPAKPKRARKPKAAPVTAPAETPASDAPTGNEQAPVTDQPSTADQPQA